MPWVKLDSSRATHRKLRIAGFAARGLDEAAMCQVCEDGTDGFLSDGALAMLAVAHREKRVKSLVDLLCSSDVNRWEKTDGGYLIHDYLVYNPTRAEWEALLARRQASGRAGGLAKAVASAVANSRASAVAKPLAVTSRSVTSDSEESHSGESASPTRKRDELFEAVCEVCEINITELTSTSRGPLNRMCAELRGLNATPDEIKTRAKRYLATFSTRLTPPALVKHWPTLGVLSVPNEVSTETRHITDMQTHLRNSLAGALKSGDSDLANELQEQLEALMEAS